MARVVVTFTGINGSGTVAVAGLKQGDLVLAVTNLATNGDFTGSFGKFVTTDGELYYGQSFDLSSTTLMALLDRELIH